MTKSSVALFSEQTNDNAPACALFLKERAMKIIENRLPKASAPTLQTASLLRIVGITKLPSTHSMNYQENYLSAS